jgi:Phage integrase family/Arm DNA-binding domain
VSGQGTVIKRGSTFSVVLDLGRGPDGRRVRKWHSGYRTKKDAERAQVELLAALSRGAYVLHVHATIGRALADATRWSLVPRNVALLASPPRPGRTELQVWTAADLWRPAWTDSGLVFTREDGRPLHPREVTRAFTRHVLAAELPMIRLHDLRHTHATLALAAGVHPKIVQERLGHANIAITLDSYSHAVPALEEQAAATVAALVFGQ